MKTRVKLVLLLLMIHATPMLLIAQIGEPGNDPDVPIDGGLSFLAVAGVTYVVKKGYDKRKKVRSIEEMRK